MANYFVGDIQGCFNELQKLLAQVSFNPAIDTLWSCGDVVARGPDSYAALEFFYQNQASCRMVLGNHDLHLLAVSEGIHSPNPKDKIDALLHGKESAALMHWLREQPLIYEFSAQKLILCHAGVPPAWDVDVLKSQCNQVQQHLTNPQTYQHLLRTMYGQGPVLWHDELTTEEQMHYTINGLTRMRFVHQDTSMNFTEKGAPNASTQKQGLKPWFELDCEIFTTHKVIFGHWASLLGQVDVPEVYALDTGCVWGEKLTLWHLEKDEYIFENAIK